MLSMTQSTESKEKKEIENPAQDGQDLLMLSVVVTEEATMLKVTTRMPKSTWASPNVSRACSQGRWRRR